MSHLDDFLVHNIEGYLFYDLRTMERDDPDGKGVGFPLLMSTCAGIEFFGALFSTSRFRPFGPGCEYFGEYWRSMLYSPPSPHAAFGDPTYQLIRHGIAHTFLLKGDVGVVRKQPSLHFTRDGQGMLLIDAVQLARDFVESYEKRVKPLLSAGASPGPRSNMEQRLLEMEADFKDQATKHGVSFLNAPMMSATAPMTQSLPPAGTLGGPTGPLAPSDMPLAR